MQDWERRGGPRTAEEPLARAVARGLALTPRQLLPEKPVMTAQAELIRHIQNYPPEIKVFVGGQS